MDFVISLLFRGTCSKHFLERPTMWQWSLFLLCWMTLDACNEIKILCRTWSWKRCLYLWSFIFFCSSCCSCSYMRSFLHFQPNASIKWESSQGSSWLVFSFCRFCLFGFNSYYIWLPNIHFMKNNHWKFARLLFSTAFSILRLYFLLSCSPYFLLICQWSGLSALLHHILCSFIGNLVQLFTICMVFFLRPFG